MVIILGVHHLVILTILCGLANGRQVSVVVNVVVGFVLVVLL